MPLTCIGRCRGKVPLNLDFIRRKKVISLALRPPPILVRQETGWTPKTGLDAVLVPRHS